MLRFRFKVIRQNKIIAVFGRKGSGKTTLVKYLVRSCRRLILIDPLAEYENGTIVYTREDLYYQATRYKEFRIIFRPMNYDDDENYTDVDYAADLALALKNATLVIDEVDKYCNSWYMSKQLNYCIQYGRHFGVYVIITSRQANRVRNDITAQADYIITFQQQGQQSLKYLRGYNDDDNIDNVINLDNYYYVFIRGKKPVDNFADLP